MSTPNLRFIQFVLIATSSIGMLAVTIFVPGLPDTAYDLKVTSTQAQLMITVYLAVFAVGVLIVGPLSDRYGRRTVLLAATSLCGVASVACALAPNLEILLIGRALQALGGCAGIVLPRTMIRDMYGAEQTARAMAGQASAQVVVPVMAPVLGGYLVVWFGWRASFVVVAVAAAVVVVLVARTLPETNVNLQKSLGLVRGMVSGVFELGRLRMFYGYALGIAAAGVCYNMFVTAAPVLLIETLGVPPNHYGFYALAIPVGFFIGSTFTARFASRFGAEQLILCGSVGQLASGAMMVAIARLDDPFAFSVSLFVMGLSQGLTMPLSYAGTVSVRPHLAGAAAGLAVFMQNGAAAIATLLIAQADHTTSSPLGIGVLIAGASGLLGCALIARR